MSEEALVSRAQRLHWDIEALVRQGLTGAMVRAKHHELAELYCRRARELLPKRDFSAWPDAFAAITHYAEAGGFLDAYKTIDWALEQCDGFHDGDMMRSELEQLTQWLATVRVPPTLADFARPVPPIPKIAA